MAPNIIEIHPKKPAYDPLAKHVKAQLLEAGVPPKSAEVQTQRLYRIEGALDAGQLERVATDLLMDPVVEDVVLPHPSVKGKKGKAPKAAKIKGVVLDIWPKPGVTDPVGETVEKGLHDLGFSGTYQATSAIRFVFSKLKDTKLIHKLAKQLWANELIHDILIRTN